MNRREEQAFNDGRVAFREGRSFADCGRRAVDQRAAWQEGFEHERRIDAAAKAAPEVKAESRARVGALKDWARQTFGGAA